MSFSLSPSVQVREFDFTTTVPIIATSIVGNVIKAKWGPCFERKLTTNERENYEFWGLPVAGNFEHWFSNTEFLRYANNLWVVRAVNSTAAKNAGIVVYDDTYGDTTDGAQEYIPNSSNQPTVSFSTNEKLKFFAKYPGDLGNSKIRIALCNVADFATAEIESGVSFEDEFEFAPSAGATEAQNEIAVAILVKNWLDDNWLIQEKWIVSLDPDAKDATGRSKYIENVLNDRSAWVYAYDNTSNANLPSSFEKVGMSGGLDGDPTTGNIQTGYDLFANSEEFDVSILMDGGNCNSIIQSYIIDIAANRLDCFSVNTVPSSEIFAVDTSTAISNCVSYRNSTLNKNTSYGALYANWKRIYDKYSDIQRWVPVSGDIAGCFSRTDYYDEVWKAPAGYSNGQFRNVLKFAIIPNKTQRDTLYKNGINPIVSFPSEGNMIWGQKTLLSLDSAFNRINVRRLFILLEKSIATASRSFLFQNNDEFTRSMFKLMVDPFLEYVKGKGGIYDFFTVCDTTNNTPYIIDNNAFVGDIYIKPVRAAEFIQLNFNAVASSVSFEEILKTAV